MAEYIERESLLKEMLGLHTIPVYIGHVTDEDKMFETMVDVVKEHPTADVVEVVRCKDCKRYKTDSYYCQKTKQGYCELDNNVKQKQGYCSHGERRCDNGKTEKS